jgi:NAD(P)-dependent dehydrogenase (short-subunit alcohol dehydrogenase family)
MLPVHPLYAAAFAGRVALVTGAGRGNGAAIARGLAGAGATVIAADVDGDSALATAHGITSAGGNAHGFALDVTDAAQCEALAARIERLRGPLHILVNNAGVLLRALYDAPGAADAWRRTMDVNVQGTYNVTSACLPQIKARRGAIVNVASIHAFVAPGVSAAYSASKGAIGQYTKALAAELAMQGVRVNAIAPGMIRTPMTQATIDDPAKREAFLRHVPMGRAGEADELVGPVLFLCSDAASYVTGVVMPVDGGYLTI